MFLNNIFSKIYIIFFVKIILVVKYFILASSSFAVAKNDYYDHKQYITTKNLEIGDIVFWVDKSDKNLVSHIVVFYGENKYKKPKVIHATNSRKYMKFVETKMKTSFEIEQKNKTYFAFRIKNDEVKESFIRILEKILKIAPNFSTNKQKDMYQFNRYLINLSYETIFKISNSIYMNDNNMKLSYLDLTNYLKDGVFCSEIVLIALKEAYKELFFKTNYHYKKIENFHDFLPKSLQISDILSSPNLLYYNISSDRNNFIPLGLVLVE